MNKWEMPLGEGVETPEKKEKQKTFYFIRKDKGKWLKVDRDAYGSYARGAGFRSDLFDPPVEGFSSYTSNDPDFGEISTEGKVFHSEEEVRKFLEEEKKDEKE